MTAPVVRTRTAQAGTTLELLVLSAGRCGLAGVDLASGALVRASWPDTGRVRLEPYSVVAAPIAACDGLLPFAPESVELLRPPEPVGALKGRSVERYLRPLVHPPGRPLLGFAGAAVPFWTLRGDAPSLALVEPAQGPTVVRDGDRWRCRFRWHCQDHDLPLDDLRLAGSLTHPSAVRLGGRTLGRALGWEPRRLLVALTPPYRGSCYKVVAALLPRG